MKNFQHMLLIAFTIVGTIKVNAQTSINSNMLVLAPQSNDVIYVNQTITSIPLLLSVNQKIDSTVYQVSLNNHSIFGKRYIQKFWSLTDPYTLDIPVYLHKNISVIVETYYQGQVQGKEKIEISLKQIDRQFRYAND